jgi:hypothetical protein
VPRPVATTVVALATIKLLRSESCQVAEVKNSWYQRSETPGSGKVRKLPELNESGTMIRIGRIRKPSTARVIAPSP